MNEKLATARGFGCLTLLLMMLASCQTADREVSSPQAAVDSRQAIFSQEVVLQPGLNEGVSVKLEQASHQRRLEFEFIGPGCQEARIFHEGVLPALEVVNPAGGLNLWPLTPTIFVDGGVQSLFTVQDLKLHIHSPQARPITCTVKMVADPNALSAVPLGYLTLLPGMGGGLLQLLPPTELELAIKEYELTFAEQGCAASITGAWSVAPDTLPGQTGRSLKVDQVDDRFVLQPEGEGATLNRALMLEARRSGSTTGPCALNVVAHLAPPSG